MVYICQPHRPSHAPRKPSRAGLPDHWRDLVRRCDSATYLITGLPLDAGDPLFKDRDQAESWLAARLPDLEKQMKRKIRPCLCCRTSMLSDGPHNRLCDSCRAAA